jgi:hypothetical protein
MRSARARTGWRACTCQAQVGKQPKCLQDIRTVQDISRGLHGAETARRSENKQATNGNKLEEGRTAQRMVLAIE